ncbi:hypothetical protein DERP_006847 [Dermatophagoides pteronyssinus]|uniref:Uncharacterized protein n=1 Tax=Dermatophagoides pteronyssinus TaxID=6956 RepID=A0ABQ8IS64_DERPT|nr:hypothetical protein DERP_006847 [Dermatophagoides pteronyssinus]
MAIEIFKSVDLIFILILKNLKFVMNNDNYNQVKERITIMIKTHPFNMFSEGKNSVKTMMMNEMRIIE